MAEAKAKRLMLYQQGMVMMMIGLGCLALIMAGCPWKKKQPHHRRGKTREKGGGDEESSSSIKMVDVLPGDVLCHIAMFLTSFEDLLSLRLTCKTIKVVAEKEMYRRTIQSLEHPKMAYLMTQPTCKKYMYHYWTTSGTKMLAIMSITARLCGFSNKYTNPDIIVETALDWARRCVVRGASAGGKSDSLDVEKAKKLLRNKRNKDTLEILVQH